MEEEEDIGKIEEENGEKQYQGTPNNNFGMEDLLRFSCQNIYLDKFFFPDIVVISCGIFCYGGVFINMGLLFCYS